MSETHRVATMRCHAPNNRFPPFRKNCPLKVANLPSPTLSLLGQRYGLIKRCRPHEQRNLCTPTPVCSQPIVIDFSLAIGQLPIAKLVSDAGRGRGTHYGLKSAIGTQVALASDHRNSSAGMICSPPGRDEALAASPKAKSALPLPPAGTVTCIVFSVPFGPPFSNHAATV